jgi:SAM-dependent methyltransferase
MNDLMTEERFHFNNMADLYNSARPGYPALLFDDLVLLSNITQHGTVLDIGCGTGKSTEPLAKRGFNVCALDPGKAMLDLCKRNLAGYNNVRYVNSSFETWEPNGQLFDLIVSGTAFHWVAESGHKQLTRVLKANGSIGIFWHTFLRGKESIDDQIDDVYKKHAPADYVAEVPAALEVFDRRREEQTLSLSEFGEWRVIRYYQHRRYESGRYVGLMRTWSTHRNFDEAFFRAVLAVIENMGGEIVKPIRTTLCFAKRNKLA